MLYCIPVSMCPRTCDVDMDMDMDIHTPMLLSFHCAFTAPPRVHSQVPLPERISLSVVRDVGYFSPLDRFPTNLLRNIATEAVSPHHTNIRSYRHGVNIVNCFVDDLN